ncbi:hypothetical protein JAAARDRAFT_71050 [Jaapia argillacea MUCL 33604]|uniref:F-box domain-containing protein n=1 Tax=Jaapia argillacea MUCL 33604 TaxID=933084 RepID=A0A067PWM7_9AGAM|nr:hypothetical protein JAAARDRAFT_71050 [Jaapia argillacea MUCL 33604]
MHKIWTIPELTSHIVFFLTRPDSGWAEGSPDLVTLSRTCRKISEQALDAIWHTLPDMRPLLRCMPPDLWDETLDESGVLVTSFCRPVRPSDWDRIHIYGPRVKRIRFNWSEYRCPPNLRKRCDPPVYIVLTQHAPVLLLNVQEVQWAEMRDDSFFFLRSLLGPNATKLTFHWPDRLSEDERVGFVNHIIAASPGLQELRILPTSTPCSSAIVDLLSRLSNLTYLRLGLGITTPHDITRLSGLPHLREISLNAELPIKSDADPDRFNYDYPPSCLERLTLSTTNLEPWIALIPHLNNGRRLQSILGYVGPPRESTIENLIETIAHCTSSTRFTSIEISAEPSDSSYSPRPECGSLSNVVRPDVLASLFTHVNLTRVVFATPCQFRLDDDLVKGMGLAWPQLEILVLGTPIAFNRSKATFHGFLSLVSRCPNLHTIILPLSELALDAAVLDRSGGGGGSVCCSREVKWINFGETIVTSSTGDPGPEEVAELLLALFPELFTVLAQEWSALRRGSPGRRLWKKVDRFVRAASRGR